MTSTDKIFTLEAAVREFVPRGCHISIGGFTLNRNPMAAVHEIIRQGIKGLHLYAHSNGQGLDELVGAGAVDRLDIAYSGNGRYAPTCINFKRAVKENRIQVEDYTNFQMALRFLAGSMGLPFLPTYSSLGTDIIARWGFDPALREKDDSLPVHKLAVIDNPFSRTGEKIVAVPAINPDVTIIHAQAADAKGTVRIDGLTFSDVEQAKAARHLIVPCAALETSRSNPTLLCMSSGVIPGKYDYDPGFLDWYGDNAGDQTGFTAFMKDCILDTTSHNHFIKKMCGNRLETLIADPETGYSLKVKR